jgi:hypothetical protein
MDQAVGQRFWEIPQLLQEVALAATAASLPLPRRGVEIGHHVLLWFKALKQKWLQSDQCHQHMEGQQ